MWFDNYVSTTIAEKNLTAADRCDACGAQAYVRVELEAGPLLFCGHHASRHLPVLEDKALSILDERERIGED